jgi:HD domain
MSQHVRHCPTCDGREIRDVSDVFRRQTASVNVPPRLASVNSMQMLAAWAERLACTLLADSLPRRWAHVQGVAAQARTLKSSLGTDADLIEAAAWLHDIGYLPNSPAPACTAWTAPATSATSSTPTRCCAAWSRTTHMPSSRPKNAAWPTS